MSYFSDHDLQLIEALEYDPGLTPAFESIKSCLVWKDEIPENLSDDGYEKMYDLLIARSFFHEGQPFSSFPLSPTRFEDVWAAVQTVPFRWPGFNRMTLNDADRRYLKECLEDDDIL